MILHNPYDSHVHWLSTGEMQCVLSLHNLKNLNDLGSLKISKEFFRGDWLIGYGWDQNYLPAKQFPTNFDLDKFFPDTPVIFTRVDGHAIWVNSEALRRAGLLGLKSPAPVGGGEIILNAQKEPSGIFIDLACELIQKHIPTHSVEDKRKYLLKGMDLFHQAGITHIRDMTCDESQWEIQTDLESQQLLKLAVEQNFSAFNPNEFSKALELSIQAKRENRKLIRVRGVKIFYDGALGSEGALLSQEYITRPHHFGLKLLDDKILSEMLQKTWEKDLEISVHVIGDQAAQDVVTVAYDLYQRGIKGKLNLEHGELLNDKTIQMMSAINISCHFQPCHWLSDKKWLQNKIGNLMEFAFPWNKLEKHGIHFDFGSDSPIEPPNLNRTIEAVVDAQRFGILSTHQDPLFYHQHRDKEWVPNCYSEWENGKLIQTVFNNKVVFKN